MKLHQLLLTAAALTVGALTTQAAEPKDLVGKELPALGVSYLEAEPDLKGKPAIVEFWATWCPPCRKSIPHLNEISKKYKDKGLVVIGISNEDQKTVETFRKSTPMEYHVALDSKGLGKKFGVSGIPHAFVVGKDGKVLWEGHPMQLTDAEIDKALK
jgi:thiol-disulfide isomerase/thioredoxin